MQLISSPCLIVKLILDHAVYNSKVSCVCSRICRCVVMLERVVTIDTGLKRAFSDSGSSARPGYPGFIVMKAMTDCFREISTSSNRNRSYTYQQTCC